MRKMLYLLLAVTMVFSATAVFSQTVTVRGTVISSSNNDGVPNATVTVKGTTRATQTDAKGNFSIQAAKGDILVLSSVGFKPMEFKVSDNATPKITLSSTEEMLGEVVVTALDIKRNPRELGYSVQKVNGEELKETQRENFVTGLQGRVSGLSVLPTSGQAGASSAVVLRGFNSLSQSNQPLFVIDGIIMDNSTIDENSNGGQGIGLARELPAAGNQNPGNRNSDYSNRASDLNPNDIETITVLKGPEATALYGSQASSGAIIITTRKAKSNQFALQYDNSFRVQKATRFPETFDVYQNGTNGVNTDVFLYFGEPYPADARKFDNIDIFFRTGFAQTHNLGMDFGVKNSVFRVSGSYFDQKGVVPENDFKRINFRISNTTKIGDKIDIIPSLAYVNSVNDKVLRSAGGYMNSLLIWPRTNSILYYEDQDGDKVPLFNSNPNAEYDNPFFSVNKNKSRDVTDRYMATLGLNFRPFEWLSLAGRFGYDTYKTDGYTVYHPQSFFIPQSFNGAQDNYFLKYKGYNHTITATAKKKVGDFNFRLMAGTMWQDYETSMFSISGNNLTDPLRTDTSNTAPATRVKLLRNYNGEYNQQILRQIAYFGEFAVNYKNMVFLSYTHRFESASTLPEQNRNYNYPGASLSLILSDMIPGLRKSDAFSYFKLRGSVAGTARLNSPYSTQSVFVNNQASGGGFSYGFTNANPNLRPEKQQTFEMGAELRFVKNRYGLDVTYYNTLNKDQIVEGFRLSYGTGYILNTQNAASTRNTGLEITADANFFSSKDFGWNLKLNFNKMWNKVIKMPPNVSEYYNPYTWVNGARNGISINQPTTTITSTGYLRNNNGDILISPLNGLPLIDGLYKVRGDRNPDFALGILNSFRYKNWKFSFLFDLKVGGDIYNGTEYFLTRTGRGRLTEDRLTPRVIKGVLSDGKQNTATPTVNTISVVPYYNDEYYRTMPDEAFIEKDVNWLKLRDATLSYVLPKYKMRYIKGLKNLEFFVTGNDLILITNYTGADPAVNSSTAGLKGVGGFGFDFGTLPTPMGVNFGLRAGF